MARHYVLSLWGERVGQPTIEFQRGRFWFLIPETGLYTEWDLTAVKSKMSVTNPPIDVQYGIVSSPDLTDFVFYAIRCYYLYHT